MVCGLERGGLFVASGRSIVGSLFIEVPWAGVVALPLVKPGRTGRGVTDGRDVFRSRGVCAEGVGLCVLTGFGVCVNCAGVWGVISLEGRGVWGTCVGR